MDNITNIKVYVYNFETSKYDSPILIRTHFLPVKGNNIVYGDPCIRIVVEEVFFKTVEPYGISEIEITGIYLIDHVRRSLSKKR